MPSPDSTTSSRSHHFKHGQAHTRTYRIWVAMKQRCTNPKCSRYKWYGARGITICPRWLNSFILFLEDMDHPPSDKHTLDRIKNHLGYAPGNCRWATRAEQMRNTRNSRPITFNGKTQLLIDWAKDLGIGNNLLIWRLNHWTLERALSPDDRGRGIFITFGGETKNLADWARSLGIKTHTFRWRVKRWGIEKAFALEPPVSKDSH